MRSLIRNYKELNKQASLTCFDLLLHFCQFTQHQSFSVYTIVAGKCFYSFERVL